MRKIKSIPHTVMFAYLCSIMCGALLIGCDNNGEADTAEAEAPRSETALQGTISVSVDNTVFPIVDELLPLYERDYPQAHITLIPETATMASQKLLGDDTTRIVILARDYLPQEREVMEQHNVAPHQIVPLFKDALVLFSSDRQTLPYVKAHNLSAYIKGERPTLASYDSTSFTSPELVSLNTKSSVYANLYYQVLDGATPKIPMRLFSTVDSVVNYVRENPKALAFGYLSWIAQDTTLHGTRIGWYDSSGNFLPPAQVHQSSIVTELYPWPVTVSAYIRDEGQFLPYGYSVWMSRDEKAMNLIKDLGLVPEHARFVLKPE